MSRRALLSRTARATAAVAIACLSFAGPALGAYLHLQEAWLATKTRTEHLYPQHTVWSVGRVISASTDCSRRTPTIVDCGFELWSPPRHPATADQTRCDGTMQVRIHQRRLLAVQLPGRRCREVIFVGAHLTAPPLCIIERGSRGLVSVTEHGKRGIFRVDIVRRAVQHPAACG